MTEQEFTSLVKRVINETINEIDGATYARVHNTTMGAQQRRISGLPSTSPKRDNIEIITKGTVVFNGEPLNGSIIVDMSTHRTYYNYRGRKSEYDLTIDPSNEKKWNELLQQLDLVIQKRQY